MAVLATNTFTYADWAKRQGFGGQIATIIEILSQTNEILEDMRWQPANDGTHHKTTIRTGLPRGTWRLFNYGVDQGKSTVAQIVDGTGMLETYAEIDKALADLNGNARQLRMSEDVAFIEGLSQQMAETIFYGDTSIYPERFVGLAPRYSTVSTATALSAANVIDAQGTGSDNASIWLVLWGDRSVFGLFPKGSRAGLQFKDMGEQTLYDDRTPPRKYQGYRSHYKWDAGLTVRDWRYIVRIANIDTSDLATMTATGLGSAADLVKYLILAMNKVPSYSGVSAAFYMNRTVKQWLDLQLSRVQSGLNITLGESQSGAMGRRTQTFNGVPIRVVDQLTNAEARVV